MHMPNERMKALEAAYLTKLHRPNKRNTPVIMNKTSAQEQAQKYNQIINEHRFTMSQRTNLLGDDGILGLTQISVLPNPQINNFNE